ncbi:MAG: PQQ-binding-like beta-propeller repeat protein, partial [Candidatus Thermoplasmatota archaeon]|nr:PQQ-binding-like beta-propeller repeat protein [Candidatus Thermoplasmatota archaeon]
PDGTLRWRKRIADAWTDSSPCIAEDGTIYIGSQCNNGGYLHAFGPVTSNSPPESPIIAGKKQWRVDLGKEWKFTAYDPDNNPLQFYIEWGDGAGGWTNERASGELNYFYHTYTERGSYTIRAKARDVLGLESDWATYAIRIPYSYSYHPGWQWLQSYFPLLVRILDLLVGMW